MLATILHDARLASRRLLKSPGVTLVVVLVLALGIGATAAVTAVVRAVLVRPLPYPGADRIMLVSESNRAKGFELFGVSAPDLRDWIAGSRSFEAMAAYTTSSGNLAGADRPERVRVASVTSEFFAALDTQPQLGHAFDPSGADGDAVILSADFWRTRFGADANVVGKTVTLGGRPLAVAGVAAEALRFPEGVDLWRPLVLREDERRGARWLSVIARLRTGVTRDQAHAELNAIQRGLSERYPDQNRGWTVDLLPLQQALVADARPGLLLLSAAVGIVLLIVGVNVAGLLLVQATGRRKEVATRLALGATPGRLLRQLALESGLLGVAGGVAGALLGTVLLRLLVWISPADIPRRGEIAMDLGLLAGAALLGMLLSLAAGLAPARSARRQDLRASLSPGSASAGRSTNRLRASLVVGELALALLLLIGGGLLLRSLTRAMAVETGFDPRGVLTLRVAPPQVSPARDEDEAAFIGRYLAERQRMAVFYESALARLAVLPGVAAAGAVNRLPLTGNWWTDSMIVEGRPVARGEEWSPKLRVATPGYFSALKVPVISGRDLAATDTAATGLVAVVSQGLARSGWGGQSPLGRRICLCREGESNPTWLTVIGVVGDVRQGGLALPAEPTVYVPFAQALGGLFPDWGMDIAVRTAGSPMALAAATRSALAELDPTLPVFAVRTLDEIVAHTVEQQRFLMRLLGGFAIAALLLATLGIYGVISFQVSSRTRELGVRAALGAGPAGIARLVLGQGARLAVGGVVLGVAGAGALTRLMANLLFDISPWDPLTFGGVALVGIVVAGAACALPAWRALRIQPAIALRHD